MNKFIKKYNGIEILKYQFENGFKTDKSFISESYNYFEEDEDAKTFYRFHCCECHSSYHLKSLTFMNKKIVCKCGAKFSADDLKPHMRDWAYSASSTSTYKMHNIKNNLFNKVSVPAIINTQWFYCNNCKTTHKLADMPIEDKQRVCICCGTKYCFEEVKLTNQNDHYYSSGKVYFDNNKITMTFMTYFSSVNRLENYYWRDGSERYTINLETGYNYTSRTGICYSEFNEYYKKNFGKNAPKMLNSTYMINSSNTLEKVVSAMINRLYVKYSNNPNLISLMHENEIKLKYKIFNKLVIEIDNYMTNYYNNKYCYKIKSLLDLINEGKKVNPSCREYNLNIYDGYLFGLRNRFINSSYQELKHTIPDILYHMQFASKKRNYKVLPRESNNISLDYICNSSLISKRLRKTINSDLLEHYTNKNKHLKATSHMFINITKHFKNKENVKKLYETIMKQNTNNVSYYCLDEDTIKLWLNYRNESYISNCSFHNLTEKIRLMNDSRCLMLSIYDVYGDDWDINSIKFYNERQFHDDLVRITNSDDYIEIVNRKKNEQALTPFEMEEEVFDIEEIENDFYVAKNRAVLTNIGQAMGICVGGYGSRVESGMCRIAYLKENNMYKACIELCKKKNTATNKFEYTIVQAKLQYNKLAAADKTYYNKILDWATRNNIKIDTEDMIVRERVQREYVAF